MEEELMRKGKDMGRAIKQLWKLSSDELLREQIEAEDKFRQDHVLSCMYCRHQLHDFADTLETCDKLSERKRRL